MNAVNAKIHLKEGKYKIKNTKTVMSGPIRKKIMKIFKFMLFITFIVFVTIVERNTGNVKYKVQKNVKKELYLKDENSQWRWNKVSNEKIDWHNYTQIRMEKQRVGPGEQGEATSSANISKTLVETIHKENGYNGALSDIISLQRSLQDTRHKDCFKIRYKRVLPTASIILPVHNEHLSVLLRTIWSIINRTPGHLLKEIIIVDDISTKEFLKDELEEYVEENFPKVKILRLEKRHGLIQTRLEGAKVAMGDVLIFLDAHCEVNVNWLPPLLDIIADDYKTCPCPFIDGIEEDTFQCIGNYGGRAAFDWNLIWRLFHKFKKYEKYPTIPYENPVMAGGLFAISSKFFWELGGYDEGLFIWGGEQFELSFKIWQCGGRVLDVPCSRVAHVYRKFNVFHETANDEQFYCKNLRRVAEVWMDEYKEYFYARDPDCAKIPFGDISKQLELKRKLKCKPFKWFLEEVAYDVTNIYPMIEPSNIALGEIRNIGNPEYCVETTEKEVRLALCSTSFWDQQIQFTFRGEIKKPNVGNCWDIKETSNDTVSIILYYCHLTGVNQVWKYDDETKNIIHQSTAYCLTMDQNYNSLYLKSCNSVDGNQKWTLNNFNKTQQDKIDDYLKNVRIDEKIRWTEVNTNNHQSIR